MDLIIALATLFTPIASFGEGGGNGMPLGKTPADGYADAIGQLDADGHLNVTLAEKDVKSPAEETVNGYVVFDYSYVAGITGITVQLDPAWFAESGKGMILTAEAIGGLSISNAAWKEIANTVAAGKMMLTLKKGSITVTLEQDGNTVEWSTSKNPMVVAIPYDGKGDPEYVVIYKNKGTTEPKHLIPASWCEDGIVYALAYSSGEYGIQDMGITGFSDTENKWMDSAANYLAARNVMTGEEQGIFAPGKHVTRAEFTVMLMDMFDITLQGLWMPKPYNDQKDVPQWAAEAVLQATAMGISTADKDGNFNPNTYNETYGYDVTYKDGCKVEVFSKNNNARYSIDIGNRDRDYLDQIYDESNKLIKSIQGFVNPLSSLFYAD